MSTGSPRTRVWLVPAALGLLSTIGLVAALLSDGTGDWISWLALGTPVAVSAWYGLRRGPGTGTP